ncbi:SDR family oxidoreductase [Parasphingorhabdus cellanae]|uniref:NmrA family NAD(P)-binding protein n=1 Tax=Parasphingorhabdus cellanae TaxID=2806553 RepID=A0ABX7T4T8_9SPHN|nr:NmrA family NAD(P)-binding protein [Parasphingorhabdus cellanae]QTD55122.1 NmrA family NAD(P)-binding protein [Parasphingorhabdus cellanae]
MTIGATGDQGHPLLQRLLEAGMRPVAALRNTSALANTPFANVETVEADLYDEQSMIAAAQGMDAIAMHLPFVFDLEKATELGHNIAAAAKASSVKKIVFNTSCYVADKDNGNPAHDGRRAIEKAIIDSGVGYAIFETKVFMDNMIRSWNKPSIVNSSIFAYPAKPDLKISWICLDDVAAFMVEALQNDDLPSGRYAIGGPQALVGDEVAAILSDVAGKPITFKSMTPDEFASAMSLLVTGSATVEPMSIYSGMASFYSFYNEQPVSPLIADTTEMAKYFKTRPTPLSEWAARQDWNDPTDPALTIRMAGMQQGG